MKNSEEMKKLILAGNFLETRELVKTINAQELEELLVVIGKEEGSFCAYTYICFLLLTKETAQYHSLAARLLTTLFSKMNGSLVAAEYHNKKAASLLNGL